MLPFLIKRREAPATVIQGGSDFSELTPDSPLNEDKEHELRELLLDALMAKILFNINKLTGDDNV